MYHVPVMLQESIEWLNIQPDGVYVDATFGGGGHARAILNKIGGNGRLFAFDQDEAAVANAQQEPFEGNPSFVLVRSNFRHLKQQLRAERVKQGGVQGILADLGVSSHQLDTADRGFSFRFDALLDMRMNNAEGMTAADVLNSYPAAKLQEVLSAYGELRNARTVAQAIEQTRQVTPYRTISDLLSTLEPLVRGEKPRYLAQVFQALRMEVNDEMGALADFLAQTVEMLAPGGRLVVISYHSLEDRMAKNIMRSGNTEGKLVKDFYGNIERPFEILTKKALTPTDEEIRNNPRARSAKFRAAARR